DERDLWPEFRRVLRDLRPRWFVGENVPGILSTDAGRFFGAVLRDLAEIGFDVRWGVHRACDVGAPHRRERVFLLAYTTDA
ncbi:MAG: DNA cytosine methyltransferase, partial [Alicyclobacillus mali]|nr:DNA cytosine methyltransferase [Alicyclobacillus mali (ex Roth et al. 2021)]